jgi:very-short-patch-repair endonuclease
MPGQTPECPDVLVAKRAMLEWGVLSFAELVGCGLSPRAIATRATNGRLHLKYRGVYAVGHPKLTLEGCFLAAVEACGAAARLGYFAAAALYGFVTWDFREIEVTVQGRGTRAHRGIRIHYTASFDLADVRTYKGIPVTSPARTLVDLAAMLDYKALRRAVRQALALNRVTIAELVATLRRLEGRRGTRKLVKIVAAAVPTRSEFEDILQDLILSGGFADPHVNAPLVIEGETIVPDFRWPGARLVVEADSRKWHDNPVARSEDAERRALLKAAGETVISVTYRQAVVEPRQTLSRIEEAGAPRV